MNTIDASVLTTLLALPKQTNTSSLTELYLQALDEVQSHQSAGLVLTNLENTQFEQFAYFDKQKISWFSSDAIATSGDSNILSFCLRTGQHKTVTLSVLKAAFGGSLPFSQYSDDCRVLLQPLAFSNVFGVAFVMIDPLNGDANNGEPSDGMDSRWIVKLFSEHFAVCYSLLQKLEIQVKRSHQLEQRLNQESQTNSQHFKRNQRLIEASLIGGSPKMKALRATIQRIASSNFNVLIRGETGTGKELVAKEIHRLSTQFSGKLIAQNCAAIPLDLLESELFGHEKGAFTGADKKKEGLLTAANNGVLFLDEVGDMPMPLQSKLLRVLQERVYRPVGSTLEMQANFRLIAATHQPLEEMIKAGTFRSDLLYRLQESLIQVPPLQERQTDSEALSLHFIRQYEADNNAEKITLTKPALKRLSDYHFPGNVRELRNIIRQSCLYVESDNKIDASIIQSVLEANCSITPVVGDSAEADGTTDNLKESCEHFESKLIKRVLKVTGGDRREAAQKLDVPVRTLAHKCQKYGL